MYPRSPFSSMETSFVTRESGRTGTYLMAYSERVSEQLGHSQAHQDDPEYLTRDEAVRLYPGQWVLMRVTEMDPQGWPAKGQILAHAADQRDVLQKLPRRDPSEPPSP